VAARERVEPARGQSTADTVAGFLAALALFAGLLALVWYPGRVGTAALLVGLVGVGMARANARFAAAALALATLCWLVGMTIAILVDRPVF
jgi:hypothetical protein